jgi:hypothetical protein
MSPELAYCLAVWGGFTVACLIALAWEVRHAQPAPDGYDACVAQAMALATDDLDDERTAAVVGEWAR